MNSFLRNCEKNQRFPKNVINNNFRIFKYQKNQQCEILIKNLRKSRKTSTKN